MLRYGFRTANGKTGGFRRDAYAGAIGQRTASHSIMEAKASGAIAQDFITCIPFASPGSIEPTAVMKLEDVLEAGGLTTTQQ